MSAVSSANFSRYLVQMYYSVQDQRIAAANRLRRMTETEQPHATLEFFFNQASGLERQIARAMRSFAEASEVGRWSLGVLGIGPVLAAGLLAHIDIERAPTVGHIWRFAGLDPTVRWRKGQKRPWNADLKVLAYKIGESFKRLSGREDAFYGRIYRERKELEVARNNEGRFADTAAATLAERNFRASATRTEYEAGRLPPGRLDQRACRYAVKLFLSHWHHVAYEERYGIAPPKPYVIEHLGHSDYVPPPEP